ncbi:7TM diverse intracellular signaling domain-containing protein [Pseudobacteriovorax antillogorgiicola]|uniref:histidine kinase n=1 Tax=Pseudobacteriovorax antillogorgiicola TaxID=1513793 RepID=A0A1Y6C2K8_9BACT|nr:7TM diverse intracellular signaling domain-containing protein [Pseudobacteriovorax antillogorgiicola]TCS49775.1 Hpt domain-containing protein [Pseudobacteriovorax antillogorgiicola]SMF42778.1 Hpt domain-containing protein [Pseudobacteriovorax antillogorgiicola]
MRLLLLSLILLHMSALLGKSENCQYGYCDLMNHDWEQGAQALDGPWAFYWGQLLDPELIASDDVQPTGFLNPRAEWNGRSVNGVTLDAHGSATFWARFDIKSTAPLTLKLPGVRSASKIWVNGVMRSSQGMVASNPSYEVPYKKNSYIQFTPRLGRNHIVIQMSNASYFFGGGSGPVVLGTPAMMLEDQLHAVIKDSLILGCIIIMVFYHVYLWWIRKTRLSPLYYGIFCFAIGFRSLVAGQGELLMLLMPDVTYLAAIRIEYLGFALGIAAMSLLTRSLYPDEMKGWLAQLAAGLGFAWMALIMVTDGNVFPALLKGFQVVTLVFGLAVVAVVVRAWRHKRDGAAFFLAGFGVFFLAIINDILDANRIVDTVPMSHVGLFAFIFFQSLILSTRFDRAYDRAEQAEKEVRGLNEGLERKVDARTKEINRILNHVQSGFILVDPKGLIMPGFTRSCSQLLDCRVDEGQKLSNLLSIDRDMRQQFDLALDQVMEGFMPTDVSLSLIPRRIQVKHRTLDLTGSEIRDEKNQEIAAILFTITDVTSLTEAEETVRNNEMLLEILRDMDSFKVFLEDFNHEVDGAEEAARQGDEGRARALLHTVKGNLGAFGLRATARLVHDVESQPTISPVDVQSVRNSLYGILEENHQVLDIDMSHLTDTNLISQYDIDDIKAYVRGHIKEPQSLDLQQKLDRLMFKPVRSFLGPIQKNVQDLASQLEKEIQFELVGGHLRFGMEYSPVFHSLIHMVRNAVDHGIEDPAGRGHKAEQGSITLSFESLDDGLRIMLRDDGRGMDVTRIREKAFSLGIISEKEASELGDDDIRQLIFHPGFSTSSMVTEISGRGVGMAAVAEAVAELRGAITINSTLGEGSTFTIFLPFETYDRALAMEA